VCYYILDEKKDLIEVDLLTWGQWFENMDNRRVGSTYINDYHISTVFLGINHSFHDKGEPLVYETMVFIPKGDDSYMRRYHTWNEAELGHMAACDWVRNGACED
jgi:hypothetical protein